MVLTRCCIFVFLPTKRNRAKLVVPVKSYWVPEFAPLPYAWVPALLQGCSRPFFEILASGSILNTHIYGHDGSEMFEGGTPPPDLGTAAAAIRGAHPPTRPRGRRRRHKWGGAPFLATPKAISGCLDPPRCVFLED